ncbi:hypothetical protein [Parafrigoribacterium mesophilum]|uniref:hypothetical protein n=1 Tax=Parafrigoribacterium mesophilum TaxID=433646 RepID=UPI0031FC4E48
MAGAYTIVLGVLVAIVAGGMIAHPPLSIFGAILLVVATILMSIGCVWLVRRSWDEPWPEEPDEAKLMRRRRRLLIVNVVRLSVALAFGAFFAVNGDWWAVVLALVLACSPTTFILMFFKLRAHSFSKSDRESRFSG